MKSWLKVGLITTGIFVVILIFLFTIMALVAGDIRMIYYLIAILFKASPYIIISFLVGALIGWIIDTKNKQAGKKAK